MMTTHPIVNPSLLLILIFSLLIAGCQSGSAALTPTSVSHFIAPTANPAVITSAISEPSSLPTRQIECQNQLKFLDDLTIPDGSEVEPGQKMVKRWLVKNSGSCNWDQTYSLLLISGLSLGAETDQQLYPARQNTESVVEIIFSAPDNPGRYNTWWQASDPDGNRFGDPIYMDIAVINPE
jgi:hypothetical protein